MTAAALSPAGALAWLASLSIDLGATAVLDPAGAPLAGDADVARRAAAALAADPAAPEVRDGALVAVRGPAGAVAATLGPLALVRVALLDLHSALAALGGR